VLVGGRGVKRSAYGDVQWRGEGGKDDRKIGRKVPGKVDNTDSLRDPKAPRKLWHASPGSSGH
jgi:error-prone DNA polymerase